MSKRSPVAVFFLTIFTLGIYGLVWLVKTKGEMCRFGADIPTAWVLLIPFVSIWWIWKYAGGVEKVTKSAMSQVVAFIVLFILGVIGMAIIQDSFNKVDIQSVVNPA